MDMRALFYDRPEETLKLLDVFSYTPTIMQTPARNNIKRECGVLAICLMDNLDEGINLRNALQSLQQLRAQALNGLPTLKTEDDPS